jgi:1-acyl-sn-glycerol-3-phosphate acyltransferase
MKKLKDKLTTFWFYLTVLFCFAMLIPLPLLLVRCEKYHTFIYRLTKFWVNILFSLNFLSIKVEYRFEPEKGQLYVFAPNHTSYLDIPMMMSKIKTFFIFVGKSSISKAPLLGYVYKKMHITVDRSNARSKYSVLEKSKKAIQNKKSILIFPEGGIVTTNPPQMTPFKEGAFRLAIEEKVPIVPVTIINNWKVMPDERIPKFYHYPIHVIFHNPIETAHLSLDDLPQLRQQVFDTIDAEIKKHI